MKPSRRPPHPLATPVTTSVLAVVMLAILTSNFSCQQVSPPPHEWDKASFGPLVPHETFPADCSLCHVPERWDELRADFQFDHYEETGFRLVGAHAAAACLRCHNDRGPVQEFLMRGCAGCHGDPHEGTFARDCEECHQQTSWRPGGVYAEHARTRFPLIGAHIAVACERCHQQAAVGIYEGTPVECHLCHQDEAFTATSIDHVALGWTVQCQRCHSPTEWSGDFRHTTFALVGAHRDADCTDCHQNQVYLGTPRDCYSCHAQDYLSATNPDHVAGSYPTNCETCHSAAGWRPASFDHDALFPLQGSHSSLNCTDCHQGSNYNTFSCINCHAHRKSEMDDEHDDVSGYVYSSPACLSCHPTGKE